MILLKMLSKMFWVLVILIGFIIFNPYGCLYITDVSIKNDCSDVIYVTLVGEYMPSGNRSTLGICAVPFPYLPSIKIGKFKVKPGKDISLLYDGDDVNVCGLVVFREGKSGFMPVDEIASGIVVKEEYIDWEHKEFADLPSYNISPLIMYAMLIISVAGIVFIKMITNVLSETPDNLVSND